MDKLDEGEDIFNRSSRKNAVAEVEDVSRPASGLSENFLDFRANFFLGRK